MAKICWKGLQKSGESSGIILSTRRLYYHDSIFAQLQASYMSSPTKEL